MAVKFKARSVQRGDIIDYTPVGDTPAGTVVQLGPIVGVTKLDIKAGELGAIDVTGVYECEKATGTAISKGDKLYFDATSGKAVKTPSACYLGVAVTDAASADTLVRVLINVGASDYADDESSSSSSSSSSN